MTMQNNLLLLIEVLQQLHAALGPWSGMHGGACKEWQLWRGKSLSWHIHTDVSMYECVNV